MLLRGTEWWLRIVPAVDSDAADFFVLRANRIHDTVCADHWESAMANKEQRGNREKRKPKKEKPKPAPNISSFPAASTKIGTSKKRG